MIHDIYLHTITVFMGFFAMLNPIGNVPVFIGMVQGLDDKTMKNVALRALLMAFAIITIFCVFGHIIFRLFGITIPAFQIAGGIIVFIIGFQMLNASDNTMHRESRKDRELRLNAAHDMAISPLGTPLLAGPGTISTAMNFVGVERSFLNVLIVIVIFGLMCAITYFLFISGRQLSGRVNPALLKVVSRIMGLILAVIAIQMLINGIEGTIDLYRKS